MPGGRPTDYSYDLGEEICSAIADNMLSLKTLCAKNPHWPVPRTIRRWARENPEFSHMYAQAKEDQGDLLAEDMLEIADDSKNDTIIKTNKDGSEYEVANNEWINRSRLRVDTRKWIASKFKPRMYGDKSSDEDIAKAALVLLDHYRKDNAKI
ncbi:MAG TPA: hypothetical protein VNX68_01395 [Nitrosopumilaceae archaeon]|jgi:hypothetical protein|nr:hypothetical protein [Nitrosopumilaceae archaeon]